MTKVEYVDATTIHCAWCRCEQVHLIDEFDNHECSECHELNDPKPRFGEND